MCRFRKCSRPGARVERCCWFQTNSGEMRRRCWASWPDKRSRESSCLLSISSTWPRPSLTTVRSSNIYARSSPQASSWRSRRRLRTSAMVCRVACCTIITDRQRATWSSICADRQAEGLAPTAADRAAHRQYSDLCFGSEWSADPNWRCRRYYRRNEFGAVI